MKGKKKYDKKRWKFVWIKAKEAIFVRQNAARDNSTKRNILEFNLKSDRHQSIEYISKEMNQFLPKYNASSFDHSDIY